MAADRTNVYFLIRMRDIDTFGFAHPYVAITLDTDRSPTDTVMNFNADDSGVDMGSQYFTNGTPVRVFGERQIIIRNRSGVGQIIELYADDGVSWYAPPASGNTNTKWNASQDAMEVAISRADLGLTGSITGRFVVASYQNNELTWANDGDSTSNAPTCDAVDSISIYGYRTNYSALDPALAMLLNRNAFNQELSDADLDFWFDVKFNTNGIAADVLPTFPDTTNTSSVTVYPTNGAVVEPGIVSFKWGASTDTDDRVTSYFFELSTNANFDGIQGSENGTNIAFRVNTRSTNQFVRVDPSPPAAATQLYWRVRARDQSGALSGYYTNLFQVQSPDDDTNGPQPFLVYVGSNYAPGAVQTNITDADLNNSNNFVDIAVGWTDPSGVFLTNHSPYASTNVGGELGRVIPNWDLFTTNPFSGSVQDFGFDRVFTNFTGADGMPAVTTWYANAFTVTNVNFSNLFFLTLSAEDDDNDRGSVPDDVNEPGDAIPDDRTVTTNFLLQFTVVDDDDAGPFVNVGVNETGTPDRIWINEFEVDNPGTDSNEWVEIAGLAGVSVTNYQLLVISGAGATSTFSFVTNYVFSNESQGHGFFIVGAINPAQGAADYLPAGWANNTIPNGGTNSLRLRRLSDAVSVHTIDYGGDNPHTATQDQVVPISDGAGAADTLYAVGRGINFYDFTWTNTSGNATLNALDSNETFLVRVTDQAINQGGYAITGTILDAKSGVLVDNPSTNNVKPKWQLKNNAGTTLFSSTNTFMAQPAIDGGGTSPTGLGVTVAASAKGLVDLGVYTGQVTSTDADNDRANDQYATNQPVLFEVQDDDTNTPSVTGVNMTGTGGGLTKSGNMLYYDFDDSDLNFDTNAETVVNNVTDGGFDESGGTLGSIAGGNPDNAASETGWTSLKYYFFSFVLATNYDLTITNIVFHDLRTGTGPTNWMVRYSVDGFVSNVATGLNPGTTWTTNSTAVSLAMTTGTNTFRILATNATAGGGRWSVDNVTLQGTITPSAGTGFVSDQDSKNGSFSITGLVQDSVSGVFSNKNTNTALGTSYSLYTPSNQVLTNRSFATGPASNGAAQSSAVAVSDSIPSFNTNDILIGVYTTLVFTTDFDDDRTNDFLTGTNVQNFSVVDDDTNAPRRSATTNMSVKLGTAVQNVSAGAGSNVLFALHDGSMRVLDNVAMHLFLYVNDDSALVRGTNTNDVANLSCLTITNLVTNNVANFNSATSSPASLLGNYSTNVWSFTNSLSYDQVGTLFETTNKILLTMQDADNDRANDRMSATNVQFGRMTVTDDDPSEGKIATNANPLFDLTTNASTFVFVGGDSSLNTNGMVPNYTNASGGAFAGTNIWVVDRNNPATDVSRSNQVFLTSDGSITNLTATAPLHVKFLAFDAESGLAVNPTNANAASNTTLTIGSVIVDNVTNYDAAHSVMSTSTTKTVSRGTQLWNFVGWSTNVVGQFFTNSAGHSNKMSAMVRDADFDRPGDQMSTNVDIGWFVVYDDDAAGPTMPGIVANDSFTDGNRTNGTDAMDMSWFGRIRTS